MNDKSAPNKTADVTVQVVTKVIFHTNGDGTLSGRISGQPCSFIPCKSKSEAEHLRNFLSEQPREYFVQLLPPIYFEYENRQYLVVEAFESLPCIVRSDQRQNYIRQILDMAICFELEGQVHGNLELNTLVVVNGKLKSYGRPINNSKSQEDHINMQARQLRDIVNHIVGDTEKRNRFYQKFRKYLLKAKTIADLHSMTFHPYVMPPATCLYHYSNCIITLSYIKSQDDHMKNFKHIPALVDVWTEIKQVNKITYRSLLELHDTLENMCPDYQLHLFKYMHSNGWHGYFKTEQDVVPLLLKFATKIFSEEKNSLSTASLLVTCQKIVFTLAKFQASFGNKGESYEDVKWMIKKLEDNIKILNEFDCGTFENSEWSGKTESCMTKEEKAILELLRCVYFFIFLLGLVSKKTEMGKAVKQAAYKTYWDTYPPFHNLYQIDKIVKKLSHRKWPDCKDVRQNCWNKFYCGR